MKFSSLGRVAVGVFALLLGASAFAGPPGSGYHLIKKVSLSAAPGGKEYFDYLLLDPDSRRLYVSHGTEVKVLDADTYAVLGTIGGLVRCHGIALVKDLGKGFITDGEAAKVVIFDIASLKVTGSVKSYPDTDSIVYDPASKLIFTFNGDSKNSTVIDPAKGTVVKTIDLGGGPEFPVADGKGMVYDNNEDLNAVLGIDTKTLTIKDKWPTKPAGAPTALALDEANRRLFSAGRDPKFMVVMNADTGKVIQSFPITAVVDADRFEPDTGLIFVSTGEGYIHIFHEDSPDKYTEVDKVKTEYGARTMEIDPKTHRLFVTTADFGPPPGPGKRRVPKSGTFRLLVYGK
jgi:DNA-binding beta-propeller fold protein YncE